VIQIQITANEKRQVLSLSNKNINVILSQVSKLSLSIIIVSFNSEKYIDKCIQSILDSKYDAINLEVIVIDNNSTDSTVSKIRILIQEHKNIFLVQNKRNVGFAKAVNIGLKKRIKSELVILLNPDTQLSKTAIINLVSCAELGGAGIVGGSTYSSDHVENGSYFRFPNLGVGLFDFTNLRKLYKSDRWHKYFYYKDMKRHKLSHFPVDVVTGGFMLIRQETINKIGYLDERFFMYLEDVDYCLRAMKAGIKIIHCNKSKILHFGGASSNNKDRIRHTAWLLSRKLYFLKNFDLLSNIIIQPVFLIDDVIILLNKYY